MPLGKGKSVKIPIFHFSCMASVGQRYYNGIHSLFGISTPGMSVFIAQQLSNKNATLLFAVFFYQEGVEVRR
jgi:hypothetical protein